MSWLRVMGSAVCLLAVASCTPEETLPPELLQTWRNPKPAYHGRYFELREGWVVFGTGRFTNEMHPIESVESTRRGATTEYVVRYKIEDTFVDLRITHAPGPPASLRLGQRDDVWVPESAATWLEGASS